MRYAIIFQSTLPAGEATKRDSVQSLPRVISIHASRGGSDIIKILENGISSDFNPRFPRGKRLQKRRRSETLENFNPRFPRGKRRMSLSPKYSKYRFQSTLPAGEATTWCTGWDSKPAIFQSTLPAGEATKFSLLASLKLLFQSTLPAGEATMLQEFCLRFWKYFNPRFPRGKRPRGIFEIF